MPTTSSPRFHSVCHSWPPINPAAPVTRIFIPKPSLQVGSYDLVAVILNDFLAPFALHKGPRPGQILAAELEQLMPKLVSLLLLT